ncbi:MAG: glycoside hydrolase family 3 C-terminal domain-containing protein [Eubacteriales bacterium]|nr:glycoside hydrolase family 3 C-terminal domain-containing protein [Eubacteriales bacterium]
MEKKKRKGLSNRVFAGIWGTVIAVVLIALMVGNYFAMTYKTIITQSLRHPTTKYINFDESGESDYFVSDYNSEEELFEHEKEISEQIEAEGIVLMENQDQALPLISEAKVSLFSLSSVKFKYGGAGSGAIDESKVMSLKEAFEAEGYAVNPTLWDMYASSSAKKEAAAEEYTDAVMDSFKDYNDAAIVVISRKGTEALDREDEEMTITEEEVSMLQIANDNFDKVIVLLNTGNAIELGWMNDYSNIKSCLFVGFPGQEGVISIPRVLNGTVNPSGRLVDTYAYNTKNAAAMQNFGYGEISNGTNEVTAKKTYVVYGESLYVGYRYYETRYEDCVLKQGNADQSAGASEESGWKYETEVQFPFGTGLSYTEFSYDNYKVTDLGSQVEVTVDVTNKGDAAGKEVVQLYAQSPYTDYDRENLVEKSSVVLVNYAKTELLEPGEKTSVTMTVDKSAFASYDAKGAKTYIMDEGTYYLAVGNNAHDALNNILAAKGLAVEDGMTAEGQKELAGEVEQKEFDAETYSVDQATGNEITNQFDNASMEYYDESYRYLTRNDWEGTWPTFYGESEDGKKYSIEASEELLVDSQENHYTEDENAVMPVTGSGENLKLVTMKGKSYDDPEWEAILDCLTVDEMVEMVRLGGWNTAELTSVSKPRSNDQDGPAGISDTLIHSNLGCMGYPAQIVLASTWNDELAEEVGVCIGEDGLKANVQGWYAPGAGTHRTSYGGRNYEYYSEDGYLGGGIAAAEIRGVQSKGINVYMKHLVLNDQEDRRYGINTFATEQSIREIYLKPFERATKEANCTGFMAAFASIGPTWCGASEGLIKNVCTNEWGFHGIVVTDYASANTGYMWIDMGLQAGCDLWLNTDTNVYQILNAAESATMVTALRDASHDILYTIVNGAAMNGMSEKTDIKVIMPLWQKWIIMLDVGVAVLAALGIFLIRRRCKRYTAKMNAENE